MVDRITKNLRKMSGRDRPRVEQAIARITAGDFVGMNIKKMKNQTEIYRARVGDWRVIFQLLSTGKVIILDVDRRSEKTYRRF